MRSQIAAAVAASALAATTVLVGSAGTPAHAEDLSVENFDGLTSQLQPSVDETGVPADVLGWTHTAPDGWTVQTDPATAGKGTAEWRGWSFTTRDFWSKAAPGQGREAFTKGTGVIAVADNDEWDDHNSPAEQRFDSTLTSPSYDVTGHDTVHLNFDSSYRQTGPQVAALAVSFDGGAPARLFEYSTATLGDQVYLENRSLTQPVDVPAGASSMQVSWIVEKAVNDWYWAVDNIAVSNQPAPGSEPPMPDRPGPEDVPDGISDAKVLFLDFDGIRYDKLLQANTPNLDALAKQGQFGPSYIQDNALAQTSSGPGHSNLLTGVWPDKHNVRDNGFADNRIDEYPDVLTRIETADPGFSTFSTLDWAPINQFIIDKPDVKMQQTGASPAATDALSTADAVEALTTRNPDALFVYLHQVDAAGHSFGAESPQYIAAIEKVDEYVGELVAAVRSRATYDDEDWLIIASTDHGMKGFGHGGNSPEERTIWTLAVGGGVPVTKTALREWRQVDLVPTILRHLGIAIDPDWGLDGIRIGTVSTDPFDALKPYLRGVVDEPAKPPYVAGWTRRLPHDWSVNEKTPAGSGTEEYRGWTFMSGEFWTSSEPGQNRGSFVRGRDVIAVADADEWDDKGNPTSTGKKFDSTLRSPWQRVRSRSQIDVSYVSHYWQVANAAQPQQAQLVAEFDNGVTKVLWSADSADGARLDVSKRMRLSTVAPVGATKVRIGWQLVAGNNGYWAIDAPSVTVDR